jgi:hypothetical protein
MNTDVGEYLVGAYLKIIELCDVVDYNARPPVPGLEGMGELDVIGLNFTNKTSFLCEVATHLGGLEYGKGYDDSLLQVRKKHDRQRVYAQRYLSDFEHHQFMFWCPRVPKGKLTKGLSEIEGLELVINEEYTRRVKELCKMAEGPPKDYGNPVFRVLQILGHLR